ncbi:16S rRNA (cytosine(1402)-N(4))-methyltransferase RsmH [Rothia mucilaginosa]|uniref:16S rRNA (cytosine(1402)-N(4))-methyltransferase RsmH n=1 Tax=Rothia mucilaginosa TaxID=43675 RepID=UPI0028E250DE|nr:16S rRNA (cytosine(1402)-N(4))-methyltransferase RsmH [Rothia mucilaginosa]
MSVDHAPETGTTASGAAAKVTGASIENLSQREASERHVPVMLDRCINLLAPGIERAVEERGTAYVIDGTLGMGGHSEALLERFENLVLIGIDRDLQAHAIAGERLARFGDRFVPVHAVYDEIDRAMETAGVQGIDGILMDLGVSSMQLDERTRGFAYSYDAPLDMRMNSEDELTARIVVNEYSEDQLRRIIRNWGEEKFASRIARSICTARANAPLETTGELVRIIQKAVPVAAQRTGGHPAKRTFQALRIEVNHELEALERAVPAALDALNLGGRFVAMSYHSLEDKIVKRALTAEATSKAPKGFPVELEEHKPTVKIITRGAEPPTDKEIEQNSRAASAKLRAAEKIRIPAK